MKETFGYIKTFALKKKLLKWTDSKTKERYSCIPQR